ncbi:MAG: [FeFe] hydrogenase H-cluster maturation GTPase HydF [Lachnospiraceae bacterium]|jgi:[FeFe] hydrogenase H-cluster maturation GTPase HydF|uniref:[FeFe] hydrogenase H-cluster maturation GTPase HydF n=1 Tax=Hominisplanchenecus murintestinalis TaxID=2941517 RepID=A0AC61QZX8_9FIRM|nr:[FeFe] hydrogenase H-cluster maturation GTPase HydF [Hominisplanchenecus murintestinalis]MCI9516714.1 [FeFe] hydrogenase H-cluster maturation GTPase HydF [Lachnospiraceae bacterium]RKJ93620.1 [FeFe] hydrogenase H-cluster maturation GTPase HydF [Anaerotruncus sp. 1XD22-93]MCI9661027.1 [FeFe] hydrogenase H-cluster maturation GTPase HydF [Lachnospiraceae bacterium]NBH98139.1 [FeFe] hydrogenase H-cluster maturation GTPase HydF [Lachnospiraceae bacterium]NBI75283.1 [FeFe] hydrogenase H-cluster m
MNSTPSSERIHIGIFGKRNAGKSSVMNALTGQSLAVVSDVKGTTTDPVSKAMELLPLGPVVMIDTPGIDDEGELGELRVQKSYQVLNRTDIALLVVDGTQGMSTEDERLLDRIREKEIPWIVVFNKSDLASRALPKGKNYLAVSSTTGENIEDLKTLVACQIPDRSQGRRIVADLLEPSDFVVLVVPIDKAAPKGRLILPQQQTIRDTLEAGAVSIVVKENELKTTLETLGKKPRLVITDSQVFQRVAEETPEDIALTSFSILFARYKGELKPFVDGVKALESIQDGDKILISEGCTHRRQCNDIGTVKLPMWIRRHTGKEPEFSFTSGMEFPADLSSYKLIVHCGGCMLNEREMRYRLGCACDAGVPITNYGILIAYMNGILERSLEGIG